MKIISFESPYYSGYGIHDNETVAIISPPKFPGSILDFIRGGKAVSDQALEAYRNNELPILPGKIVRLLTPIASPGKVVAIGLNYMDHCREQNIPVPTSPIVFTKFTTSIIGPGEMITWDPALTSQVDYEVELGVVIRKTARNVPRNEALDYVFGYTVINDVSARDIQFGDKQWVRGKSLDTFCPIGPCIVTADEIPDPQQLRLSTTLNGIVLQDSSTAEMIFSVAELIHRLSHSFTLEPGDMIATGTPDGVGMFRKPPIFMKHGDHIVVEVEHIGRLENRISL
jgi:2-keto-4-pentenoate hydratase/2-oxohepta-3-ene-1,7-dioic acid hydratase in catechol pathway